MNREAWLQDATLLLEEEILAPQGVKLPEHWAVGVGFPKSSSGAIGQAWAPAAASDGKTCSIFLSPILGEDRVRLLATLLHECIHVAVGHQHRHGGEFKRVARAVGLEGKLTATFAGPALHTKLLSMATDLGEYPHVPLTLGRKFRGGELPKDGGEEPSGGAAPEKKPSRWPRYQSTTEPTYTVVVSARAVEAFGPPRDPWGNEMEIKS